MFFKKKQKPTICVECINIILRDNKTAQCRKSCKPGEFSLVMGNTEAYMDCKDINKGNCPNFYSNLICIGEE